MNLKTHPEDRKIMTAAISELLGIRSVYMRAPTYAFQLGDVTVCRDGTIESGNEEVLKQIAPMLVERGWLDVLPDFGAEAPAPVSTPEEKTGATSAELGASSVRICEPAWEVAGLKNLIHILYTRQYLINRMLRMDQLFIDEEVIVLLKDIDFQTVADLQEMLITEEQAHMIRGFHVADDSITVTIPHDDACPEREMYYAQLITAICKLARSSKRTKVQKQEPENDKYVANSWLTRLGFGGPDFKALRHAFMAHLNGYAAFRNDEMMQAHKNRLAEQRRIKHGTEEEAK